MAERFRRSALYMPASNPRAIAKAQTLPCDVVILDLEDAVASEAKIDARAAAIEAARASGFGNRELIIRANGLDTPWGRDDLTAIKGAPVGGVLLPKVSDGQTLADARSALGSDIPLWAMIETPMAILHLAMIAQAAAQTGLTTFVAGTNDLVKDMRCVPGPSRANLLPALTQIVTAARAYGLTALDGVCNVIDDENALGEECRQGKALGFDGKTLIHPTQIAGANQAYSPSAEELSWATRIVEAFAQPENANKGAIRLEGKMVELLHLADARTLLAQAGTDRQS